MTPPTRSRIVHWPVFVFAAACLTLAFVACSNGTSRLLVSGGEIQSHKQIAAPRKGPYVLIFALDGVGYDQFTTAIRSGQCPNMQSILGRELRPGIFEHAYSAPNAVSILPSTTIPGWAAVFTGAPPARNGIPGNEWFERRKMQFYAPAPVSVKESDDAVRTETDDLVGGQIEVPTLFQMVSGPSFVSLNAVHKNASIFTIVSPGAFASMLADFAASKLNENAETQQNAFAQLDLDSVPKIIDTIEQHGVPTVQVAYFPGIDLYTHLAEDPLRDEVKYLKNVTDACVGKILEEYKKKGVLDQTFVLFVSDHGHTPVLKDEKHALGSDPEHGPPGLLEKLGYRVRKLQLSVSHDEDDYQAVVAYQGAIAYIYLADRSACASGNKCHWDRPPRMEQDVMPVVRAFYRANTRRGAFSQLYGTIDLIFARKPVAPGQVSLPYQVYDGHRLLPIEEYLRGHPRPDLVQLDRRMRWLSAGRYGDRAGDVLLLAKSGMNRKIQDRYYFSRPYRSWHGSASKEDSHITLVLANQRTSGADLHQMLETIADAQPSHLDVVPIVRAMLKQGQTAEPAVNPSGSAR